MGDVSFRLEWKSGSKETAEDLLNREWVLTNGLGGYASGTLYGYPTRRYHGLLISALAPPFGRQLFLNHLSEIVVLPDGSTARLGVGLHSQSQSSEAQSSEAQSSETQSSETDIRHFHLSEFRLEDGLPAWRYELDNVVIERHILMLHRQNTVHVSYLLMSGDTPVQLQLRPSVNFRSHDERPELLDLADQYTVISCGNRLELHANESKLPSLQLYLEADEKSFKTDPSQAELLYREEKNRGYPHDGGLWTPGYFQTILTPEKSVTLIASTEPWEAALALTASEATASEKNRRNRLLDLVAPELRTGMAGQLVLAADQFLIAPVGRLADSARAHAVGEHSRSVIAGYHWFTDWGRDTMISLEGLALVTGRTSYARWIIQTFSAHLQNGLIPNMFPEGQRGGLYHTADATLWFFHAVARYVETTNDLETLRVLLPKFLETIEWHKRGTKFGIGMDPNDKLMKQGAAGYQLTWMDAKVDDWVVTPRRGKAVEINALWYNALRLMQGWLADEGQSDRSKEMEQLADEVYASFNKKFWNETTGHLFDVVEDDGEGDDGGGNDPACRPNQLFAVSLPYPVLAKARWEAIVSVAEDKLLTPVGLRSLSPDHKDYKSHYYGDLRTRDAAYHQGSVWGWLIGPFVDAWLKVYPDKRTEGRRFLDGYHSHLTEAGLGSISEIFDAEPPFAPRGCIAQAWSVAEVLRCLKNTAA